MRSRAGKRSDRRGRQAHLRGHPGSSMASRQTIRNAPTRYTSDDITNHSLDRTRNRFMYNHDPAK